MSAHLYYKRDGTPVAKEDWNTHFAAVALEANNQVATDLLANGKLVSTIFLGSDRNYGCSGPPIIYETMVFDGDTYESGILEELLYSTKEEALVGHTELITKYSLQTSKKIKHPAEPTTATTTEHQK